MISDELDQSDIDDLLGSLTDDDSGGDGGGDADDALSALAGLEDSDSGDSDKGGSAKPSAPASGGDAPDLPDFEDGAEGDEEAVATLESLLSNVSLKVRIRLGKTEMLVEDLLAIRPGRVVQLDAMSGDPVDILVNDRVVAKGEVIILNEAFCVRVTEIFSTQEKLERQN